MPIPNKYFLVLLLLFIADTSHGQRDFSYRRPIGAVEQKEWYNLPLPADLFKHVNRNYSDLRILALSGTDTTEIPYLLKIHTDVVAEEAFSLTIFNQSKSGKKQFFTVQLPEHKKVNTLYLEFKEKNFNGYVSLEGSDDRKQWFGVAQSQRILSIHTNTVNYQASNVSFPLSAYAFLRISVESDVPLTLERVYVKNITTKEGISNKVPVNHKVSTQQKQSIVTIQSEHIVPVNRVVITAQHPTDYYRSYYLQAVTDSIETPKGWVKHYVTLKRGYLTSLRPNEITFEPTFAHELKLTLDNQDNLPITINEVKVYSPEVTLIAQLTPGDLFLFYGNSKLSKPNYDLVYFKDKVPDSQRQATLLKEESIGQKSISKPLFTDKLWLWGIMALVIGVLGFFTLRMLPAKG